MEDILLNIGNSEFEIKYSENNHNLIFVNGREFDVELLRTFGSEVFTFLVNRRIYQISLDFNDDSNLEVNLDGMSYKIEVSSEMKKVLSKYTLQNGSKNNSNAGKIKAPMPGMVIKLLVKEGMHVLEGDKIIILEAMKMENTLKSPVSGLVKSILVNEGDAVEKGALLIDIE